MKNLKVILALAIMATFVITSCNKEELFQNNIDTSTEELSSTKSNSFIELVKDDVYPVNLLSAATIKAFNEGIVMLADEIGSADESVLKADLNEGQINLLFSLLAERDYDRAGINVDGNIELRGCEYVPNRKILKASFPDCYNAAGGRCKVCPEEG